MCPAGSTLTVEPGVEARFQQSTELQIHGRLVAVGLASQPITFTVTADPGQPPQPGWWYGISMIGSTQALATAELDYTTVEYSGRSGYGDLSIFRGQVVVKHSLLHFSAAHGINVSGNSLVTVEASRIVDNTAYGIRNTSSSESDVVVAANDWWGAPADPPPMVRAILAVRAAG